MSQQEFGVDSESNIQPATPKVVAPEQQQSEQAAQPPEEMTDMAYIESLEEALDSTSGLGEAGGGAWVDLGGIAVDKDGNKHAVRINLTSRARNPKAALKNLMNAISFAAKEYKLYPYQAQPNLAQSPAQRTQAAPATQAAPESTIPAAPVNSRPANAAPAAAAPTGSTAVQEFAISKMKVTPAAGGKVKIEYFSNGDRYPRISSNLDVPGTCELLKATGAWEPQHFSSACEYNVNIKVIWKNSDKLNTAGNPYKNIVRVEPA